MDEKHVNMSKIISIHCVYIHRLYIFSIRRFYVGKNFGPTSDLVCLIPVKVHGNCSLLG
jgi:hypothetical protein